MEAFLFRVTAATFEEVVARDPLDPRFVDELLYGDGTRPPAEHTLELNDAWHHLHYALCGQYDLGGTFDALDTPLAFLLNSPFHFGAERSFTGHANVAVAEIAEALARVKPADLHGRCDARILREHVYRPQPEDEVFEGLFPQVQRFVAEAARLRMPLISHVMV